MAITKTWTIETLERDITDGYVLNVFWVLTGKNGNEIINQQKGKVEFIKPSSLPSEFINYEDLDEKSTAEILDSLINDKPLKPGSFRGRKNTSPEKNQSVNGENHA
mgnify:CR=1 FL=1